MTTQTFKTDGLTLHVKFTEKLDYGAKERAYLAIMRLQTFSILENMKTTLKAISLGGLSPKKKAELKKEVEMAKKAIEFARRQFFQSSPSMDEALQKAYAQITGEAILA